MEFHSYSEYRKVAQKYDRNVRKISNHVGLGKACYISLLDGALVERIVSKKKCSEAPQGSRSEGLECGGYIRDTAQAALAGVNRF